MKYYLLFYILMTKFIPFKASDWNLEAYIVPTIS